MSELSKEISEEDSYLNAVAEDEINRSSGGDNIEIRSLLNLLISKNFNKNLFKVVNPYKGTENYSSIKTALHVHTIDSVNDKLTQTNVETLQAYKDAGYGCVALTNHDAVSLQENIDGVTMIRGVEESGTQKHICAVDITEQMEGDGQDRKAVLAWHKANNPQALLTMNHPYRPGSVWTTGELQSYKNADCLEIYNTSNEAKNTGNAKATDRWDVALKAGNRLWGIATDDCHHINIEKEFNHGWVEVLAPSNSKEDIMASLKSGKFYACHDHDIKIYYDENSKAITASSSKASNIAFIGGKDGAVLKVENNVLASSFIIEDGTIGYIRVESVSAEDTTKFACSQPFFIESFVDSDILLEINTDSFIKDGKIKDMSSRENNPSINGFTAIAKDSTGKFVSFDGVDDYLELVNWIPVPHNGYNFTLEFYGGIDFSGTGYKGTLLNFGDKHKLFQIGVNGQKLRCKGYAGTSLSASTDLEIFDNTVTEADIHHFVIVCSKKPSPSEERQVKYYRDGELKTTITSTYYNNFKDATSTEQTTRIGTILTKDQFLKANIGYWRLYNRALTEEEIIAKYNDVSDN